MHCCHPALNCSPWPSWANPAQGGQNLPPSPPLHSSGSFNTAPSAQMADNVLSPQSEAHPSCSLHKIPICPTTHTLAQHPRSSYGPVQPSTRTHLAPPTWHLPPSRTDRCKDSPLYKSLEYYNALPASIRDVSSRPAFKQEIGSRLINSICFCSAHPLPYL